ncbi:MAG TPA: hypothetical protein VFW88_06120 [Burkholderiales bacterium]|nr:hypothetical protein [Burkholderiales bacterium]
MVRVKQLRKSGLLCATVLAFGIAAGGAPQAFALEPGRPELAVFAHAPEIPDSALSQMRGRFIAQGQIVSFGISMVSQWITPLGQTLTAGATMGVELTHNQPVVSFQPNLNITQSAAAGLPSQNAASYVDAGGGIRNVSGVAQGIQVAGDSNSITNNTSISVTTDNINLPAGGTGAQGAHSLTRSGATVTANLGANGVGVSITVPNQGQVIQQIQGGSMKVGSLAAGSGLVQLVQTSGSLQQIQNVAHLQIQLKSLTSLTDHSNFNHALNMLQGLAR